MAAVASLSIAAIKKSKKENESNIVKLDELENIGKNEDWAVDAYLVGSTEKENGSGSYPVYLLNMDNGSYICALRFRNKSDGGHTDEDGVDMPQKYDRWKGREDEDVIVELREWKISCDEEKNKMIKEIEEMYGLIKSHSHPSLRGSRK